MVTQYRIVEMLYLVKQYEATTQLEKHITDLYELALKFHVKANKFHARNTARSGRGEYRGLIKALLNDTDLNCSQSSQESDQLQQQAPRTFGKHCPKRSANQEIHGFGSCQIPPELRRGTRCPFPERGE